MAQERKARAKGRLALLVKDVEFPQWTLIEFADPLPTTLFQAKAQMKQLGALGAGPQEVLLIKVYGKFTIEVLEEIRRNVSVEPIA